MLFNISHADREAQSTGFDVRVEAREGGVFSCTVGVSSSLVWGRGEAVCELQFCTPPGVLLPAPVAAPHILTPPAGRTVSLEDCSWLERRNRIQVTDACLLQQATLANSYKHFHSLKAWFRMPTWLPRTPHYSFILPCLARSRSWGQQPKQPRHLYPKKNSLREILRSSKQGDIISWACPGSSFQVPPVEVHPPKRRNWGKKGSLEELKIQHCCWQQEPSTRSTVTGTECIRCGTLTAHLSRCSCMHFQSPNNTRGLDKDKPMSHLVFFRM